MKPTLLFLLFNMLLPSHGFSKTRLSLDVQHTTSKIHDTVYVARRDTVIVMSMSEKAPGGFDWSKNMPWIGAIGLGLLTIFANLMISNLLRKSSAELATRQIDNANVIALAQLEMARKNSERDFNKTVLSGNRQIWITDLRNIISELLSLVATFSLKQSMDMVEGQKLQLLITKAELMLNGVEHGLLSNYLKELKKCCSQIMMQTKSIEDLDDIILNIKTQTSIAVQSEWDKVKKGE